MNVKSPPWIDIGLWFWLMNIRMGHTRTHNMTYSMTSNWTSNSTHIITHIAWRILHDYLPLSLKIVSHETVSIRAACGTPMLNKLISGYSSLGPFLRPIDFATHFTFADHKNTLQIKFYVYARPRTHTIPNQIVSWEIDTNSI